MIDIAFDAAFAESRVKVCVRSVAFGVRTAGTVAFRARPVPHVVLVAGDDALAVLKRVAVFASGAGSGIRTFGTAVAAGGTAFSVVIISALADADGIVVLLGL